MRRPRVLQDFRDILGRGMPRPYRVGNSCAMPDSVVCCEEIDGTPIEGNYLERVIFDSRGTGRGKRASQPVSRVLSRTIIHLRPASPRTCSGLPESGASYTMGFLFGLAPGGVYLATDCYQPRGALLPHHFTLTGLSSGGMLSVALAVGSRLPGVTWRPALWSPDFPLPAPVETNSDCPADSATRLMKFPVLDNTLDGFM